MVTIEGQGAPATVRFFTWWMRSAFQLLRYQGTTTCAHRRKARAGRGPATTCRTFVHFDKRHSRLLTNTRYSLSLSSEKSGSRRLSVAERPPPGRSIPSASITTRTHQLPLNAILERCRAAIARAPNQSSRQQNCPIVITKDSGE